MEKKQIFVISVIVLTIIVVMYLTYQAFFKKTDDINSAVDDALKTQKIQYDIMVNQIKTGMPSTVFNRPTPPPSSSNLLIHLDAGNIKSYPGMGKIWFDLSGKSNHFEMIGTVNFLSGIFNVNAVAANYFVNQGFKHARVEETSEFWCKVKPRSEGRALWGYSAPTVYLPDTTNTILLSSDNHDMLFNPKNLTIYVNQMSVSSGVDISDGKWTQVVRTSNRLTGEEKLYINGVLKFTTTLLPGVMYRSGGSFMIGQDQDCVNGCLDSQKSFEGSYSIFKLYDRVLTDEEVMDNFNTVANRYMPTPSPTTTTFSRGTPTPTPRSTIAP